MGHIIVESIEDQKTIQEAQEAAMLARAAGQELLLPETTIALAEGSAIGAVVSSRTREK